MKYLQKLLAIFLILFSMMIILSGLFNYKENGGLVSVCLVIGGGFILYLSSKTLIFNPKSMKNLKGKIRKIELITKYGHEGKIIALKEVYSEKNKQELLKRYNNDYRKINKDEKLVIIDELKERKLIAETKYEEKLNKINEEIKEKENKKLIQEKEQKKNNFENRSIDNFATEIINNMKIIKRVVITIFAIIFIRMIYLILPAEIYLDTTGFVNGPLFEIPRIGFRSNKEVIQREKREKIIKKDIEYTFNNANTILNDYFKNQYNEDIYDWQYADSEYKTIYGVKENYENSMYFNVYLKKNPKFQINVEVYDRNKFIDNYDEFKLTNSIENWIIKNGIEETHFFFQAKIEDKSILNEVGTVMALKEVYKEKHTKELLERYRLDYNRVHNDVKLVMIEELKKRELISKEEYEDKLNKINEEKKTENFSREEEELNKIKEEVKVENEEKLRQEKRLEEEKKRTLNKEKEYEEAREKLDNKIYKKNNFLNEKEEKRLKKEEYVSGIIMGIFIGVIPLISFFSGVENADPYLGLTIIIYPFFAIIGCFIAIIVLTSITKNFAIFGSAMITFVVSIFLYQLNLNISNQIDEKRSVALSIAAKEKDYKKCEKLLEKYKNKYNESDSQGYNSLHYALINKDENLIRLLVENKIYLITKDNLNSYKFFDFSKNTKDIILNDLEILWDGSPNKIIFKEIYETKENQKELIERFYENGMSVNIKPEEGRDNLLRSVIFSKVSDAEKMRSLNFLTEHGIEINRYSSSEENIFYELIDRPDLLEREKVLKYVEYLAKKGLNVNSTNRYGENLLHIAFGVKNNEIIDFLIKNKVNLEQKNKKGKIPLLEIFNSSKISIQELKSYLNYYYENNANPFIADNYKENIVDYINKYNEKNEDLLEKKDIEEFKNELIKSMKNKNGD